MDYQSISDLPKEKLVELCTNFAKNWLAMDGLWFQSIERKFGMDEALFHDVEAWKRFTIIEARRIKEFLSLPDNSGLEGLRQALSFRFYAALNQDEFIMEDDALIYRMVDCRVQTARNRKGMAYHPCKPVAVVEYSGFASEIDSRIETECLSCHPDVTDPTCNCSWKFTLKETI